ISVSNAGSLAIQSVTAGQPTTINFNGGPLNISAASVTVGDSATLGGDNDMTITTAQLTLGSTSTITTSGASLPVGVLPTIFITSPAGSDLTIQSPSGSSAIIQTPPEPLQLDEFNHVSEATTGSIIIIPGNPATLDPSVIDASTTPALTFANSDSSGSTATTLRLNGGPFFAITANAATKIGKGVTVTSDGPTILNVNNSSFINYGTIESTASANRGGSANFTLLIFSYHGPLTLDGNPDPLAPPAIVTVS